MTRGCRAGAPRTPAAVVFGDLGLIRSLGEAGVPVVVAGSTARRAAYASRYASRTVLFPPYETPAFLERLLELGAGFHEKPVLLTDNDKAALAFARHQAALGRYFRLLAPDAALVEALVDKRCFARLAEVHGLPTPVTYLPGSPAEVRVLAARLRYPCIVKPAHHDSWNDARILSAVLHGVDKKAIRIDGPAELVETYDRLVRLDSTVLIQDYVEGPDESLFDAHVYRDPSGRIGGVFVGRKIRTWPPEFGTGSCVESVREPGLAALAVSILREIDYRGVADVNFKRAGTSGPFVLLEINPRFSLWTYLASRCGVNLPLEMYRDLAGLRVEGHGASEAARGVRWIFFKNDLKAYLAGRRSTGLSWRHWLASYRPGHVFHLFSWRDPLPAAYSLLVFLKRRLLGPREAASYPDVGRTGDLPPVPIGGPPDAAAPGRPRSA